MAAARQRPLRGDVRPRRARPLAVPGRRLARPPRHVAARHGAQAGRRRRRQRRPADRVGPPRPGARARQRPADAAALAELRRRLEAGDTRPSAACRRRTSPHADGHIPDLEDVEPEHGRALDLDALFWRVGLREPAAELARPSTSRSTPCGPGSAPGTSSSPARRWRRPPATARCATPSTASTTSPSMGFDVLYLPPVHPIGADPAQGPQQHAPRRRRPTPAARGRSAAPRAATPPCTPSWARSTTSPSSPPPADDRDIELASTSPSSARRTTPGSPSTRVVRPPPRRHDPVRREPAQEVPGHLPARLRERRLAGAVGGARRRDPLLDRRRASRCSGSTTRTPRRSPSGSG